MFSPDRRMVVEFDLRVARRRAAEYLPYSPAWDAAMARIEDLERMLWLLERARAMESAAPTDRSRPDALPGAALGSARLGP